jgi:hypothetical protein
MVHKNATAVNAGLYNNNRRPPKRTTPVVIAFIS